MKPLIELDDKQCHYPVNEIDEPQFDLLGAPSAKHLFCGEPVARPDDPKCVYCAAHMTLCYRGEGVPAEQLFDMMSRTEQTVSYTPERNVSRTPPVHAVLADSNLAEKAG